jgi:alpha-amylase
MSTPQAITLYLHAHQPYRVKHYTIYNAGQDHNYFNDETPYVDTNNRFIVERVAQKSYLPTNKALLELMHQYPEFKISLSIPGTLIDLLEAWVPEALDSFKELIATGKVEIVAETYHHSLAFFYSREEFEAQVQMHRERVQAVFGQTPTVFRNTELSYNNELAKWADNAGYKGIITEGWDPILQWRSPNFTYKPVHTQNIRLLMKNYRLSDDVAFRFGDKNWSEWPLTADKFAHWLGAVGDNAQVFNLFMDYETFGEHQWEDSGIFDFLKALPEAWIKTRENRTFMTLNEAIDSFEAVGEMDIPHTITWADTERDLTAWLGNSMQQQSIEALYSLEHAIKSSGDWTLIEDWRKLQASDHFYFMCTKWFSDGDVHAYFSPYKTPYEAFTNFMNAWHDLQFRLIEKGIQV